LEKRFGHHHAVSDVSFEAPDGAITGLLGCNGAGKTTTLAMIAGALTPDAGSVSVDGPAWVAASAAARDERTDRRARLGALLDQRGLYPRLTVRENIEYFARLQGMRPGGLRDASDETLAVLGLEGQARRRAAGLSEGERMKVALGRVLVHRPRNLLLDEPTNGLDVTAVRGLRDALRRMRDRGACVLFSSHVLDEVRQLCDRVVVIAAGRLVAEGTPEEIRLRARAASLEDAFVALSSGEEVPA
jgi:sodium transport system ATP-binding protein